MWPDIEKFHSTKEMLGYVLQNFSKKKKKRLFHKTSENSLTSNFNYT